VETYTRQERAAMKEKELREAEARAKQQTLITESELSISIQSNQGKAEYERSRQEASRIQTLATAEAEKIRILGEGEARRIQAIAGADAERTARVGIAQAMAIEEQVRAYGGPRLQLAQQVLTRFAEAIQSSQVDVVPKIVITGQGGREDGSPMTGSVMEGLLTLMMSERLGGDLSVASTPRNASADAIRQRIEGDIRR
jgi:uncharacterized membrane protein YqiK